jgi:hypothetical protein
VLKNSAIILIIVIDPGPIRNEDGAVEKSRQRRSRHFSVLTYWKYALRAKLAAALLGELF